MADTAKSAHQRPNNRAWKGNNKGPESRVCGSLPGIIFIRKFPRYRVWKAIEAPLLSAVGGDVAPAEAKQKTDRRPGQSPRPRIHGCPSRERAVPVRRPTDFISVAGGAASIIEGSVGNPNAIENIR